MAYMKKVATKGSKMASKAASKPMKMSASKNPMKVKAKVEGKEMPFVEKMKAAKKK